MALRTLVFGLLGWLAPALLAEALGWRGIWGGGSALVDYLIPIPVAGGALHVPSFVLMLMAVHRAPNWSPRTAGRLRALALGAAVTAALMLWPPPDWRLSQNPLALFVLGDALLALLALTDAPRNDAPLLEPGRLLALLAVPALAGVVLWRTLGLGDDYRAGTESLDADRVQLTLTVTVKRAPVEPEARAKALAWAMTLYDPRVKHGVEVVGLRFLGNEGPAGSQRLCLYEDGNPPRWLPGDGDCLAGFTAFATRLARHLAALPADTPPAVRDYLAGRAACTEIGFKPPPAGAPYSLASVDVCERLPALRAHLAPKYPALVR